MLINSGAQGMRWLANLLLALYRYGLLFIQ